MIKRILVLGLVLVSCQRPAKTRWQGPGALFSAVKGARTEAVEAYYLARAESRSQALALLKKASGDLRESVKSAMADTLGLALRERKAYRRALVMLDEYAKGLLDTATVYSWARFRGQAPFDRGLEEASVVLLCLALQHQVLGRAERALGKTLSRGQRVKLKDFYPVIMSGGAGPELGIWPNPEPAEPGEGLVLEAWSGDDSTAEFLPILLLRKDTLLPPQGEPGSRYYLYGPGFSGEGVVEDGLLRVSGSLSPEDSYLALPARAFWWDSSPPPPGDPDSALEAFRGYLKATGFRFDSLAISSTEGFWVWPGKKATLIFGNAFRGRKLSMFTLVAEGPKVVFGESIPGGLEFLGVEVVGVLDLDYDRIQEVVLALEGEDSRSYQVLKRQNGVWWKILETEAITEF